MWVAVALTGGCTPESGIGGDGDTDPTDTDTDTDPGTTDTGTPPPPADLAAVRINELMSNNQSTANAPDGTFADWVELVNTGDGPVDLADLALRNSDSDRWAGAEGQLAPGEHLRLWAGAGLDLGFGLDKDGDKLTLLVADTDAVIDFVDLDALSSDVSLARFPDGTGALAETARPSPGADNGDGPSETLDPATETVFTDALVHMIEFTVSQQGFNQLSQSNRPEVHTEVSIDGVSLPDVGLKLKGSASYNDMSGKPAFIVDLNAWVPGTKFRDLKAFKLHNGNVYDPTRTHDYLTYQLARESGLMAPRVGWAQVFVNGADYGIYMVIEKHDDVLIEYHAPDQEEVGVMLEPNEGFYDFGGGGYGGALDESAIVGAWEEGLLPPDPAVLDALFAIDDLIGRQANDANVAALWEHVDQEQFLTYHAWETLVMHTDGYRAPNNWRLFVNGTSYLAQWVPAGAEWTWDSDVDVFPGWGGAALRWCIDNPGCKRLYAEEVLEMADRVETLDLATQFEDLSVWLDPLIQADPRYNPLFGSVNSARTSTRTHLAQNPGRARTQVYAAFPDLEP
ncbi:MAG: CotH kinase family protein [Myxococcota bacterium]